MNFVFDFVILMIMKSNYLSKLVDTIDFTADIPKEELWKLQKHAKLITVKKDQYFLRAGEIPERIGYNVSGLLRLFYIDYNGIEVNKHFCFENSLAISYSAFLQRQESKIYIQALEETQLYTIDYKTYEK